MSGRSASASPESTSHSTAFVVTLLTGEHRRSQIWNSSTPLALGQPFRWIVERGPEGVRVRPIGSPNGKLQPLHAQWVTDEMLSQGTAVRLTDGLSIAIKPVFELDPVFSATASGDGELRVYSCVGNWVVRSEVIGDRFTALHKGEPAFCIVRHGASEFRVESPHARLVTGSASSTFKATELAALVFRLGTQTWRFDLRATPVLSESPASATDGDGDGADFKSSIRIAGLIMGAFLTASLLWPKPGPHTEELIPPQFAKIVLTQQPKESAPQAPTGAVAPSASSSKPMPKSIEKAAVVQAFRATQLRNAVSGLLKGGMTSLLSQSDFVAGSTNTADARRMLGAKSDALVTTAPDTGDAANHKVAVAAVGGGASGGRNGAKGVGYGKGEKAGVTGQGRSLVSMDTPGASVEEGLTKDEVGEVIHRHMSEVRYCYESAMLRQPDIEGKLLVNFTISGSGAVKTADVKQSTLPDPRLDDCIIRRLMTWKFPNTKGGIEVAVTYPFIFKTLGR